MEEWRSIQGYPNYEVSNKGNVRSIDRLSTRKGGKVHLKGKLLKPTENANGYKSVILYSGNRNNHKKFLIHRLVALAFINKPINMDYINHKDENKGNNNVDNLEWCDCQYNSNYGTAIQRRVAHQNWQSIADKQSKAVAKIDNDGNVITRYKSTMDAQRIDNYNPASISKCCNGYLKTYKGYKWEYEV